MGLFIKVKTTVPREKKFMEAGPVASWLWLAGVCYCRDGSTDGFIPKMIVPTLVPQMKGPFKHAARLVEVRLWDDAVGGYMVHDYLHENPSREQIEDFKAKDRARKPKRFPDGIQSESERSPRVGADAQPAGVTSPSPSGSAVGFGFSEESARETGPQSHGTPLVDGHSQRRHGTHRWCDYGRGMCITADLHADFCRRLGAADASERLLAWYPTVVAKYAGKAIGDDLFAFWRNEFNAWVGNVTEKAAQKTAPTDRAGKALTAAERVISRQLDQRKALTP